MIHLVAQSHLGVLEYGNACPEEQPGCWRSDPVPDEFPFVSPEVAVVWVVLVLLCLVVFLRRLGRR